MATTYEPNVVLAKETFDVVGTRPIRHDGVDKVTGQATYGADWSLAYVGRANMDKSVGQDLSWAGNLRPYAGDTWRWRVGARSR